MDACGLWVPRQIDLDQGSQGGQLYGMANANRGQCKEVLPLDKRNTERTPEPSQEEHPVHQAFPVQEKSQPANTTKIHQVRGRGECRDEQGKVGDRAPHT